MRFCWSTTLFLLLVIALGSAAMLNACGQKGPLKLPEKTPTETTPTPPPESPPESPPGS